MTTKDHNRIEREEKWRAAHPLQIDIDLHGPQLLEIIDQIASLESADPEKLNRIIQGVGKGRLNKNQVLKGYHQLIALGLAEPRDELFARLRLKPTRTISGVAPVAVMTKPFPCPGECIFCPDLSEMPKSYLPDEPGALRAAQLNFDPFLQTERRITALGNVGHSTDKIELIVLGGTWSSYPRDYQEWFITRCLDAMNAEDSPNLERAQQTNENAPHRNVGLAIETRPDAIDEEEIVHLRRLGVTKVQIGVQSLNQKILDLNRRGCTVSQIRAAFRLLRAGGFKIHAHWMPNLLGATPKSDLDDFAHLWDDPAFRPDELKIYPCSLIPGTELHRLWLKDEYQPYSNDILVDLITECKLMVPQYCRITRIMRDIPSGNIAAGCKKANLRQIVQLALQARGRKCGCIRCRETRKHRIDEASLMLQEISYDTETTVEHFLSFVQNDTDEDPPLPRLAAFLRLSLPHRDGVTAWCFIDEIRDSAMIREVHVYGPAIGIGSHGAGHPQHSGLGTRLLQRASELAAEVGFKKLAVISAIGTRQYYRSRGFEQGELYMHRTLDPLGARTSDRASP